MAYDQASYEEEVHDHTHTFAVHNSNRQRLQWYDVRGLHDEGVMRSIADTYGMHPLAIENAVDVNQRPMYQEFEEGHFISLKHLALTEDKKVVRQAVAIYFGPGYVLTFQEHEDDVFTSLRHRIRVSSGRIRKRGADYLVFAILDVIVDDYFDVLEGLEQQLELLEDQLFESSRALDKAMFYAVKKELLKVRKAVTPLREAVGQFYRSEAPLIAPPTRSFLRDLYDHTIQITDITDNLRDVSSGLQDLYLSEVSLEMNRVMQFLTIITAIFVPLSFLTGVYGMNFINMPELQAPNGYFVLLGAMGLLVVLILWWLRRRRWL